MKSLRIPLLLSLSLVLAVAIALAVEPETNAPALTTITASPVVAQEPAKPLRRPIGAYFSGAVNVTKDEQGTITSIWIVSDNGSVCNILLDETTLKLAQNMEGRKVTIAGIPTEMKVRSFTPFPARPPADNTDTITPSATLPAAAQ